jgi:hypothetical protein
MKDSLFSEILANAARSFLPTFTCRREILDINHRAPGKKDYTFALQIAGQDSSAKPGPHALVTLRSTNR